MPTKNKKVRIDFEEMRAMQKRKSKINKLEFEDIEWYENGVKVELPEALTENWRFCGLSNTSFVEYAIDRPDRITIMTITKPEPKKSTKGKMHSCDIPGCAVCDPTAGL